LEGLPAAAREEMAQYRALAETMMKDRTKTVNARQAVARHVLVTSIAPILGARSRGDFDMPE
jgi:hypothetical protein